MPVNCLCYSWLLRRVLMEHMGTAYGIGLQWLWRLQHLLVSSQRCWHHWFGPVQHASQGQVWFRDAHQTSLGCCQKHWQHLQSFWCSFQKDVCERSWGHPWRHDLGAPILGPVECCYWGHCECSILCSTLLWMLVLGSAWHWLGQVDKIPRMHIWFVHFLWNVEGRTSISVWIEDHLFLSSCPGKSLPISPGSITNGSSWRPHLYQKAYRMWCTWCIWAQFHWLTFQWPSVQLHGPLH